MTMPMPARGVHASPDVVTAGTWTGVYEAGPGQTIDIEFPDVGRASARFE
jgi:2-keto-4-pentenoate hydratase